MKHEYYIVELKDGSSFLIYTTRQLPYKMINIKLYAMGFDDDEVESITPTNKAKDVILYRGYTYNIDEVYDENQGECYQD